MMHYVFSAFMCLLIFVWMSHIMNFTLLGATFFGILIDIPVQSVVEQIGNIWVFLDIPLQFVGWVWSSAPSRAIYFPLLRQDLYKDSTQSP